MAKKDMAPKDGTLLMKCEDCAFFDKENNTCKITGIRVEAKHYCWMFNTEDPAKKKQAE